MGGTPTPAGLWAPVLCYVSPWSQSITVRILGGHRGGMHTGTEDVGITRADGEAQARGREEGTCERPGFALWAQSPVCSPAGMCFMERNPMLVSPNPCLGALSTTPDLAAGLCLRAAGGLAGSQSLPLATLPPLGTDFQ